MKPRVRPGQMELSFFAVPPAPRMDTGGLDIALTVRETLTQVLADAQARGDDRYDVAAQVPAARRADTAPYALAVVGDQLRRTPLAVAGGVATPTAMPGAAGYFIYYYPLLTVASAGPRERWDRFTAAARDIDFEEI